MRFDNPPAERLQPITCELKKQTFTEERFIRVGGAKS